MKRKIIICLLLGGCLAGLTIAHIQLRREVSQLRRDIPQVRRNELLLRLIASGGSANASVADCERKLRDIEYKVESDIRNLEYRIIKVESKQRHVK